MPASIKIVLVLAAPLLALGCGSGEHRRPVSPTATPTATHPATPTPSPTPNIAPVTYELTQGSIIFSSTGDGSGSVPLTGTFVVVPGGSSCFNTLLCLSVVDVQFQSGDLMIAGSNGQIQETTFDPEYVTMGLITMIDGQPFNLNGMGPFDSRSSYPPTFIGMEICGTPPGTGGSCKGVRAGTDVGYDLVIFAAPIG